MRTSASPSAGTGSGAWGLFVNTPGMVSHGVGHPDWSHRSYALLVEDEAIDLFLRQRVDSGFQPADGWNLLRDALAGRKP